MINTLTLFGFAMSISSALAAPVARDFIVQFDAPADSARGQQEINRMMQILPREADVEIVGYTMPWARVRFLGDAYTNRAVDEVAAQVAKLPGVQGIAANTLKYRRDILRVRETQLDPAFADETPGLGAESQGFRDLLPGGSWLGGPSYERLKPKTPPEVNPQLLAQQPGMDPLTAKDWAMQAIRVPAQATRGAPVLAGVIDTGIDYNHADLRNAMWRDPRNPSVVGYDFTHKNERPYDLVQFDPEAYVKCLANKRCKRDPIMMNGLMSNAGHGTHCAGHIGSVADNSYGIRAPGNSTQLLAMKVFHDAGEVNAGAAELVHIIRAVDYAITHGVRVINASLGHTDDPKAAMGSPEFAALVRARAAGILVVVAAGNDSLNQDGGGKADFPAAYSTVLDNVLAVAATDQNDKLAEFSNYGARSVQLAAPGTRILSTVSGGGFADQQARLLTPDNKVIEIDWDGTSFSAPLVTGAAARIWSEYPRLSYLDVKNAIVSSARRVPGLVGKVASGGVLDVTAALERAKELDAAGRVREARQR